MFTKEQKEAFMWRVLNTFKSVLLPVVAGVLLLALNETPDKIGILATWELWEKVLYAVFVTLLGSIIAGADKVVRM